ncbi:hypothetical protein KR215_009709, partial [Drosophila sulfurigaster]
TFPREMKFIIYASFYLSILTVTSGNILRVTGFKCRVVDPSFCYYERCDIKAINRNVKEFNVVVRLHQKPVNNVTVRLAIVRRLAASTQPIYQFEIDGCQFMVSKRRNPFAKAIYKYLRIESFSNLNHSCPFDVSFTNNYYNNNIIK